MAQNPPLVQPLMLKTEMPYHIQTRYPKASSKLINNCYVDDVLDSCESKLELIELIQQFKIINEHAGFKLHGWASNSALASNLFGASQNENNNLLANDGNFASEKVLGLRWACRTHQLTFNLNLSKIP